MNRIEAIAAQPQVQVALKAFEHQVETAVTHAIAVQQIPSPTFAEEQRAGFIESQFRAMGLMDVGQDVLHNVYGRFPGAQPDQHPPVVVSAHSDTVFAATTDLTVTRKNDLIYGPGIGDNSTGVAGLFMLVPALRQHRLQTPADIWFVANVGEEGLGDLRGMRAVVDRFGANATYLVLEGGLFGQISHRAIGVRRFRIEVRAPGGHSWGNFGSASAIHVLGHLITAVDKLPVPAQPKTTYNIGVISGGTTINSIAQSAEMLLDLRSESPEALAELENAVMVLVQRTQKKLQRDGVQITLSLIGNRPAGELARESDLVRWAEAALHIVGCSSPAFIASSTDANIPLSMGYTAVCVGLTESGNAHRLDEYMDPKKLASGLQQMLLLILAAAGLAE